ncbi:MAG: hypothetical protein IAE83_04765 [Anaerolinea sp.]|nr:hypothetical protein [Anaerolinea sp.]
MKFWYRSVFLVVIAAALSLGYAPNGVSAQPNRVHLFTAGEVENLIVFPPQYENQVLSTEAMVQDILTKYTQLWSSTHRADFQTAIILLDTLSPNNYQAEANLSERDTAIELTDVTYTFTTPKVCVVWVYMQAAIEAAIFPFILAHEIAHCYQEAYIGEADNSRDADDWWVEGSAEWLAALVYPFLANAAFRQGPTVTEFVNLAQESYSLTDSFSVRDAYEGYGSAFWWMYLADPNYADMTGIGDPYALVTMLRSVPTAQPSTEAYDAYLEQILADDAVAMIHFGIAVAEGRMQAVSSLAAIVGQEMQVNLPFHAEYNPDHFSLAFQRFRIEAGEEVRAVEITAHGTTPESAALFAIGTASQYRILSDGESFRLCLNQGKAHFPMVLTRGNGTAFVTARLTFDPITEEGDTTCDPPEPQLNDLISLPGWEVTRVDDPSAPTNMVVFLPNKDGSILFEVWDGQDVMYERVSDNLYTSDKTLGGRSYTIQAELKIMDEQTRSSTSTVTSGPNVTANNELLYRRTNQRWWVMTEVHRNLIDYGMLGSCLGLRDITPGVVWTQGDPLVPVHVSSDSQVLSLGSRLFSGGPRLFILEATGPFGTGVKRTRIEITLTTGRSAWILFHEIVDKRRDCQLIYDSELYPFSGDFEGLQSQAR